jgi:hypothetical protein
MKSPDETQLPSWIEGKVKGAVIDGIEPRCVQTEVVFSIEV